LRGRRANVIFIIKMNVEIAVIVFEIINYFIYNGYNLSLNVNVGASSCTINNKLEVAEIYFTNNKCTVNYK